MQLKLTDNPLNDVRVANPWNELKDFCLSFNLNELDEMRHKHIPYVIIQIQALEIFKQKNGGKNPQTSTEKNEYKEIIKSMRKYEDEINFDEAINFYYYANKDKINPITPELSEIFDLLNQNPIEDLLKRSNLIMSNFFIVCKALQNFYIKTRTLPVVGNIIDMTSDTETYIKLKRIYEAKGKEDREIISKLTSEIISRINDKDLSLKVEQIKASLETEDINYINIISKNYPQISLFHYSSIKEEEVGENYKFNDFDEEKDKINFIWYLLIKTADLFFEKHGRYPGQLNHDQIEQDIPEVDKTFHEYLNINDKISKLPFDYTQVYNKNLVFEFCRFSNSKVVPAVSIISSIAAQEIIKLITYQFKTINNTIIFDGVNSTLSRFKL